MESQMSPNNSGELETAASSIGSEEVKNALQCLYREIQDLLITVSMLIYKQYMLRHKARVNKQKSSTPTGGMSRTDWSRKTSESKFTEVLADLRAAESNNKSHIVRHRLASIRDAQREQEQLDLMAKLENARIECTKLRKLSVSRAKDALSPFMTSNVLSCRDSIIEEARLTERAETLRVRYETLLTVLDNIRTVYRKAEDSK